MKQITKLRICDRTLLGVSAVVLASGIQLEILHGTGQLWIILHVILCTLFMALCGWHIWLHFKKSNWFARFRGQKSQVTRILWWTSLLILLTGIVATIQWVVEHGHAPVGGVHGKIGFLMMVLVIGHVAKRRKFYGMRSRKSP